MAACPLDLFLEWSEMGLADAQFVDRSEAGKLALVGAAAGEFLDGQVTNQVDQLAIGTGVYAALLTPKGKMLGDLRVLRTTENELLLICERVALQGIFDTIRRALLGWDAALEKRTLEMGMLSLIGDVDEIAPDLGSDEHASVTFEGGFAVRTDVGIDIVAPAADMDGIKQRLIALGAMEIGAEAAEVVRVEHGRPRYGVDLDDS